MVAAGDIVDPTHVNERVGSGSIGADSITWTTTESVALLTVSAALVAGETYAVELSGNVGASAVGSPSAEVAFVRVRLDNATGTQLLEPQTYIPTSSGVGFAFYGYSEYVATVTGSKNFVVTGQRNAGANTQLIRATVGRATWLRITRIVGV